MADEEEIGDVSSNGRTALERRVGQVWNTEELQRDFDVVSFCAPCVNVVRKADGMPGYLVFDHRPRFYYSFTPRPR